VHWGIRLVFDAAKQLPAAVQQGIAAARADIDNARASAKAASTTRVALDAPTALDCRVGGFCGQSGCGPVEIDADHARPRREVRGGFGPGRRLTRRPPPMAHLAW